MKRKRAIIKLIFSSPFSFFSFLPSFFLPPPSFSLLLLSPSSFFLPPPSFSPLLFSLLLLSPSSFFLPPPFLPPPSFSLLLLSPSSFFLPPPPSSSHRIPKGSRCPVMQMLIERIVLTNESSIDKNFAFYVPRDDNRFKLVPGYGVLKRAPR